MSDSNSIMWGPQHDADLATAIVAFVDAHVDQLPLSPLLTTWTEGGQNAHHLRARTYNALLALVERFGGRMPAFELRARRAADTKGAAVGVSSGAGEDMGAASVVNTSPKRRRKSSDSGCPSGAGSPQKDGSKASLEVKDSTLLPTKPSSSEAVKLTPMSQQRESPPVWKLQAHFLRPNDSDDDDDNNEDEGDNPAAGPTTPSRSGRGRYPPRRCTQGQPLYSPAQFGLSNLELGLDSSASSDSDESAESEGRQEEENMDAQPSAMAEKQSEEPALEEIAERQTDAGGQQMPQESCREEAREEGPVKVESEAGKAYVDSDSESSDASVIEVEPW
ncbi:unnamed protein product [Jaminaea pallidilutea]